MNALENVTFQYLSRLNTCTTSCLFSISSKILWKYFNGEITSTLVYEIYATDRFAFIKICDGL